MYSNELNYKEHYDDLSPRFVILRSNSISVAESNKNTLDELSVDSNFFRFSSLGQINEQSIKKTRIDTQFLSKEALGNILLPTTVFENVVASSIKPSFDFFQFNEKIHIQSNDSFCFLYLHYKSYSTKESAKTVFFFVDSLTGMVKEQSDEQSLVYLNPQLNSFKSVCKTRNVEKVNI